MRYVRDELAASCELLPYLKPKLPEGLADFQTLQFGDIAPALMDRSLSIV
jgi:hypothetical protein